METITLRLVFGKEQEKIIDTLLEQPIATGGVKSVDKKSFKPDTIFYSIEFSRPIDIYEFGHAQGRLNFNDIIKAL